MTPEQQIAAFAAWLDERAAEQTERLRFTRVDERARDHLKTEMAELEAIQTALHHLVPVARKART